LEINCKKTGSLKNYLKSTKILVKNYQDLN
jgi:hypothetical protein